MRPNNQNKNRQRGRNGGRKHVNPLSRNYESNGPDVKVRGNAAHIAEKYLQLARDAQSSGDSVMAENYLQHAEHYFRIVSSAQQAMSGPRDGQTQDENDFDDDFSEMNSRFASPQQQQQRDHGTAQAGHAGHGEGESDEDKAAPQAAADGAPPQGEEASGEPPAEGEPAPRKARERRPRRRRPAAGAEGAADPGTGPQPDVGELPAFLTAGNPANAAE
ncbi:DUF4167 domain-containing protein [Devosia sp. PTR5]|uniref:DUF4167 domain-containing protein n=1 Tax=Devosia oryzisoli TaxID=2774138 RepID=A0A927FY93_9HYPH|nr:DUF4167 domain-containing protein [Devosia oryzisoli]MBD8067003.1 DUF4167 domain-containing protein [Devosia oryzisoli]